MIDAFGDEHGGCGVSCWLDSDREYQLKESFKAVAYDLELFIAGYFVLL